MLFILATGTTVNLAINVLKEHGVFENNILLLCLFATPNGIYLHIYLYYLINYNNNNHQGLQSVNSQYPGVHILTSEIYHVAPNDFGQRYFGTE